MTLFPKLTLHVHGDKGHGPVLPRGVLLDGHEIPGVVSAEVKLDANEPARVMLNVLIRDVEMLEENPTPAAEPNSGSLGAPATERLPIPVTEIIEALEREAEGEALSNGEQRECLLGAAAQLRQMHGWERRTLMCRVDPREGTLDKRRGWGSLGEPGGGT